MNMEDDRLIENASQWTTLQMIIQGLMLVKGAHVTRDTKHCEAIMNVAVSP